MYYCVKRREGESANYRSALYGFSSKGDRSIYCENPVYIAVDAKEAREASYTAESLTIIGTDDVPEWLTTGANKNQWQLKPSKYVDELTGQPRRLYVRRTSAITYLHAHNR